MITWPEIRQVCFVTTVRFSATEFLCSGGETAADGCKMLAIYDSHCHE